MSARRVSLFSLVTCLVLGAASPSCGISISWDRGGGSNNALNPSNWNPNQVPTSLDSVILTGSLGAAQTIDYGGQTAQVNRVESSTSTDAYLFANGTFEIFLSAGNAILTRNAGSSLTFKTAIRFGSGSTGPRFNVEPTAPPIVVNGTVAPSDSNSAVVTLELTSRNLALDSSVTVAGVISDGTDPNSTLALTAGFGPDSENHRGVVRVTGNNTYTGQTIVNGVVLEFNSIGNVGGGPSALGNPALANSILRLGAVDTSSAEVQGTLRYIGATDAVTNRAIELIGGGGVLDQKGAGAIEYTGPISAASSGAKTLSLDGSQLGGGANEVSGVISDGLGKVSLVHSNTGAWRLGAANSYTGKTTIDRGELEIAKLSDAGVDSSLGKPTGADATIDLGTTSQDATLRYVGAGDSTNRPLNLGRFSEIDSSGSGPISFTAANFLASSTSSGSLDLLGSNTGANTIASNIPDSPGGAILRLFKDGAGTWVLAGNNTFDGNIDLASGVLSVSSESNLGNGSDFNFFGGSFQAEKTLRVTGNTFNSTSRTFSFLGGNTDARFEITDPNHSFSLTGTILSGATDSITKLGPGTLIYDSANTFQGDFDVLEGTLLVEQPTNSSVAVRSGATLGGNGILGETVTVETGGTLAPGSSIGTLEVFDVVFESGSTFAVEINDQFAFDQLAASGLIQLGGELDVSLLDSFNPSLGNQFVILTTLGNINGDFEFFDLPTLDLGLAWSRSVNSGLGDDYVLEVVAGTALTADVDLDGDVDGRDFLLIQRYDPSLISLWEAEYGTVAPLAAASAAVPEPSSIVLLVTLAATSVHYRRRRRALFR